jgi:hypothetical protein
VPSLAIKFRIYFWSWHARPALKAHPALLVEGLDDLIKRCEQAGYAVISDEPLEGYHRVYAGATSIGTKMYALRLKNYSRLLFL